LAFFCGRGLFSECLGYFSFWVLLSVAVSPLKNKTTGPDIRFRETELVLKVTKEIVVKFIEMGRATPASFEEVFAEVHRTVAAAVARQYVDSPD
jgi:hypothetical protein